MVRVAVAGVDVLIVVLPRLRRPELEEEREGKVPGLRALTGNLCFAEFIWQGFRTWQACCGSSASAAAARTRLVFWAGRRPPSVAANRGKNHTSLNYTFTSARVEVKSEAAEIFQS